MVERLISQGRISLPPADPAAWESQRGDTHSPADVDALLEAVRGEQ